MRVLQVIRQGEIGGGESHLMDLVSGFDQCQIESVVLAFSDGPMMDHFRERGITCYVLESKRKWDLPMQGKISQILQQEQIDLIHAHGTRAALNMLWSAARSKTPLIYTVHGWSFHTDQSHLAHSCRVLCEKLICQVSKQVICVSESNRLAGVEQGIKLTTNCKVIENGINLKRFDPNHTISQLREELQIESTAFLVGFIGRVTAQKSPLDFVKSIQLAHQQQPTIKGLLVGEGELLEEVIAYSKREKLENCIYLSNFRKDIPQVLQAIDLFCLPSLWEGLSIALLEAMAMKKTVVVTPTDGTREIIEDHTNGVIVPFNSPERLAEAYLELEREETLRHSCGEQAYQTVKERFNAQRVSQEVTNLYKTINNRPN
ncbi:MAG: glycosyltransferase family 4 protein [Phocaeicola sp.]